MPELMKRVTIYAPLQLVRSLRAVLALQGLSASEWFRIKAQEEVDAHE